MFTLYLTILVLLFSMNSCSSEFEKYSINRESDIVDLSLNGKVKEIKNYDFKGHLFQIAQFNKYGFYKNIYIYKNGKLHQTQDFYYNEYGNVVKKDLINAEGNKLSLVVEHNQDHLPLKKIYRKYNNADSLLSEHLFKHFYYESVGTREIYKKMIKTNKSTAFGNYDVKLYNVFGNLMMTYHVDFGGNIILRHTFFTLPDGRVCRTDNFDEDGVKTDYWEYFYKDNDPKLLVKKVHHSVTDKEKVSVFCFEYDQYKNPVSSVTAHNGRVVQKVATRYQYDTMHNWIENKKEVVYYQAGGDSICKSMTFKREITYYP